jgi:TolA-binding protein
MKLKEDSRVTTDIKSLISIVTAAALAVWAFFGIQEKLNQHTTRLELMEKDLELNTEFRIKWPRGLLGSLPADGEQFMLIETLFKDVEKIKTNQEMNTSNKLRIEFIEEQVKKMLIDIEKLKDSNREIKFSNGNGHSK